VMYMMSRDHLSMHIDAASLQLMLRLLSIDASVASSNEVDELCRTRQRLHGIVQQAGGQCDVTLDNMTVSRSIIHWFLLCRRFCHLVSRIESQTYITIYKEYVNYKIAFLLIFKVC